MSRATLVAAGVGLAAPTAQASPCVSVNNCIQKALAILSCHAAGGNIVSDPLNWNWDNWLDCLAAEVV